MRILVGNTLKSDNVIRSQAASRSMWARTETWRAPKMRGVPEKSRLAALWALKLPTLFFQIGRKKAGKLDSVVNYAAVSAFCLIHDVVSFLCLWGARRADSTRRLREASKLTRTVARSFDASTQYFFTATRYYRDQAFALATTKSCRCVPRFVARHSGAGSKSLATDGRYRTFSWRVIVKSDCRFLKSKPCDHHRLRTPFLLSIRYTDLASESLFLGVPAGFE